MRRALAAAALVAAGSISPAVADGGEADDHFHVNGTSAGSGEVVVLHIGTHPKDWHHSVVTVVSASGGEIVRLGHGDGADRIRCVAFDGRRLVVATGTRRVIVDTDSGSFAITAGRGCGRAGGAQLSGSGEYRVEGSA